MTQVFFIPRQAQVFLISLGLTLIMGSVHAATYPDAASQEVLMLQQHWAHANYKTEGKARKQSFVALTEEADQLVAAMPDEADAHIWAGIVYSTYAGEVSMFKAAKQVKRARAEFEQALELDPQAMNGSAYTSLGALLYQIPGFMGW